MRKFVIYCSVGLVGLFLTRMEWRSFYCVGDNRCITVWKAFGHGYIIPGKYYGVLVPSTNYIRCAAFEEFTFYFSDDFPNAMIYYSMGKVEVSNDRPEDIVLRDYRSNEIGFDSMLYMPAVKNKEYREVKEKVQFINLSVREDYATDRNGKIE